MSSVALFGGSFDPPHVGHVLAVAWALSTREVSSVLVVPAFDHAFDKALTPFPHRLRMVELAFADLRRVEIRDLEARLGGASYTVRTLSHLRAERPDVEWRLMIGSDLVDELPRWREGHRIPTLARPLVVGRGGHESGGEQIVMPDVSSTEVRRRLRAGEPVDHLVPRAVVHYVERYRLYV